MRAPRQPRSVPVRRSVRDRWHLPPGTPHLSIPLPVLLAFSSIDAGLGVQEMRVLLWLLADWWWPGGLRREINAAVVANRTGMKHPNIHDALSSLHVAGIIELVRVGRGKQAVVSIEPLIRLGRDLASEGVSVGYSRKGRSAPKPDPSPKVYPVDTLIAPGDTPRCMQREPGDGPSDPSSSDSSRRASEVGAGESPASGNGKAAQIHRLDAAQERLRRANILEQTAKWEAEERAKKEQAP